MPCPPLKETEPYDRRSSRTRIIAVAWMVATYSLLGRHDLHGALPAVSTALGHQAPSKAPQMSEAGATDVGHWIIAPNKSALYDQDGVAASLVADRVEGNDQTTSLSVLSCISDHNGWVNVTLDLGRILGFRQVDAAIRIDDEPVESGLTFQLAQDHETILLAFGTADAFKLMERLSKAKFLRIEVTPFDGRPITSVFRVTGAQNALTMVRKNRDETVAKAVR